ncbi:MAG: hypothetical protein ACO4AI_04670 [Prochlorothrix sp.]|nr:hypothetical protein [Prochlorothrix sp.]
MEPHHIQASVLPARDGGFINNSRQNWSQNSSNYYPNDYSDTGVRIGYEAVNPRPGGHGIITVRVSAHDVIRIPPIRVDFQ